MADSSLIERLKSLIQASISLTPESKLAWLNACENFSDEQAQKLVGIFEKEQAVIESADQNYWQSQELLANEFLTVIPSLLKI